MRSMYPTIIFFTAGFHPTREEREAAAKYGPSVRFRNVQFVPPDVTDGSIEQCDGVAGAVPEAYAKCRATADDAMRTHMDTMREELGSTFGKVAAQPASAPQPQPAPAPSPFAGRAPLPFRGNPKAKSGPPGFGS